MTQSPTWMSSRWWYALAWIIVTVYAVTAIQLADNTPKFDDLNDVFGFFKQLALAHSIPQKIGAFFYPNNEHVTFFNHLVYFLQQKILGEIRFYPLILFGHAIIIATACLLGCVIDTVRRPFYFAVMTIAYLNLYYWDSSFKAMTAISNQSVILFAIATFFCLLRWKSLWLAILFAMLATFSQGNGVLVWPLGLWILASDAQWASTKWRGMTIWLLSGLLAAALYYWARHTFSTPSAFTGEMLLVRWQQHPILPLSSLLAFLGSTVFSAHNTALAIAVGTVTLAGFLFYAWRHSEKNQLLVVIGCFLLLSSIIASVTRGMISLDPSALLESRYKMYSFAFLLLTIVSYCEWNSRPIHRALLGLAGLCCAMAIHASSFRVVSAIQHQAEVFRESYQNWLEDGDFKRQAVYFIPMSDHFLFVAEHLQIFDFMQLVQDRGILTALPAASKPVCSPISAPAGHCPMTIRHRGNALFITVDGITNDLDTHQQPALPANITLCDEQANAVMEFVIPETPASYQHWLIPEAEIPAGNYRVLFQPAQQPACETQLTKKPRKVKTEMRTLFGD